MSGRLLRRVTVGAILVAAIAAHAVAQAEEPARAEEAARVEEGAAPISIATGYSKYERDTMDAVLAERKATIDPHPEGKIIEGIDVVALDVFEDRDTGWMPLPELADQFHTTTKQYVIAREILQKQGDRFRQALVDESARNLRAYAQLSLVLVVAVKGHDDRHVRLVAITKDVWSIRLNSNYSLVHGRLEYLFLQPAEWNVAGTTQTVGLQFVYQPLSYSLGATYTVPRLFGSRLQLHGDANVIVGTETGKAEGSYGSASLIYPLFSSKTEWSYGVSGAWDDEITRRYVNGRLGHYGIDGRDTGIPFENRSNVASASSFVTRSFGWAVKNDFSFGLEASRRRYRTVDDLSIYDPADVASFVQRTIPLSDTRVDPFLEYRGYTSHFIRLLDFETLGLQEDYRLGHDLLAKVYPVTKALGSSRDLLGFSFGAQYTIALGDGLARGSIASIVEREKDGVGDALVEGKERIVSPRTAIGRLVFDGHQLFRVRNSLNRISFLGGADRLRGWPSNYTFGKDVAVYNLEFRTRPVQILTIQWGIVAFYDAGDAFDGWSKMELKHDVGGGLRVLFPQFDQLVTRVDVGVPIAAHGLPAGVSPVQVTLSLDQAFPMPALADTSVFTTR